MPIRIQRKRIAGWKVPENTMCIDRSTKFGNPFKIVGDCIYGNAGHRRTILDKWVFVELVTASDARPRVIELYENWLLHGHAGIVPPPTHEQLAELYGKDVACYCNISQPCHGDVLMKHVEALHQAQKEAKEAALFELLDQKYFHLTGWE